MIQNTDKSLIQIVNDPAKSITANFESIEKAKNPAFLLCLGSTMTSDIEGISAAGATAEDRRYTPRFDAEALVLGKTADGSGIPVSPDGIASPVVLTRASLGITKSKTTIVDCGLFSSPRLPTQRLGTLPAQCVSSGNALPYDHVQDLFERGLRLGEETAKEHDLIAIGECVPGGTTTALAVLTGMGMEVDELISSSIPALHKKRRSNLVNEGLEKCGLKTSIKTSAERDPFLVLSAVGDPMQPVAAGIAIGAAHESTVVLAGGSQMLTVFNLAQKISAVMKKENGKDFAKNVLVITTKWVADDTNANTKRLAQSLNAPIACTKFSLKDSIHRGLRAYEEGHVKEGVGAGGSCALAHLIAKYDQKKLLAAVDQTYNELVF